MNYEKASIRLQFAPGKFYPRSMSRTAPQVAENVVALRHRAGYSQRDLCRIIGMAESSLSQKMKGKTDWSLNDLDAIAQALYVSVAELVGAPPDRDEWERRKRQSMAVPAAPGPRFLMQPEHHFDALEKPFSRPEEVSLIGVLLNLTLAILGLLRGWFPARDAAHADRVALPDTTTILDVQLRGADRCTNTPIRPMRLPATDCTGIPLTRRLARHAQGNADLRPRTPLIASSRDIENRCAL